MSTPNLYAWELTPEQLAVLEKAGIAPWMLDIETNPYEPSLHLSMVRQIGNARAFDLMARVQSLLVDEIHIEKPNGPTRELLRSLKREAITSPSGMTGDDALDLFRFHHDRLAQWTAHDHLRLLHTLKSELNLTEEQAQS